MMAYFGKILIVAVCLSFSTLANAQESSERKSFTKAGELCQDFESLKAVSKTSEVVEKKFAPNDLNIQKSPNILNFLCRSQGSHTGSKPKGGGNQTGQRDSYGRRWRYKVSGNTSLTLFPTTDLYPSYIADPRHPRFSLKMMSVTRRDIPQTTRSRIGTSVGGSFGLLRIHSDDRPESGFQLQIGAGVFAQWDAKMAQDGIGWDGVYHVLGTWAGSEQMAFRLGINHMSSHVSDEYIENTGRERIEYTREEIVAGMSYLLAKNWRTYGEIGYFYPKIRPPREHWRIQAGLEFESDPIFFDGFAGWFVAIDAKSYEENDWNVSTALQVGLAVSQSHLDRTHRVGLEFYYGRSPMGEFFQDVESHIAFGWWLEF